MTFKPIKAIGDLKRGDIIRHISDSVKGSWVVEGVYGGYAIAVDSVQITNAPEWEVATRECHCCCCRDK